MSRGGNLLWVAALVMAACSGSRQGPDGGLMPPPPECLVDMHGQAPPFPTEFLFLNDTAAPVYLHKGCIGVEYGISSCAAGFRDQSGPAYHCTCSCDEATCTGPPACGPCAPPEGVAIVSGGLIAVDWTAIQITEHEKARAGGGTFMCARSLPLPAGRYRVAIRVFDDQVSAASKAGGRAVAVDFSLPSPDMVVEVPLGPRAGHL